MALLLTCLWRSDIIMAKFDESKHPRDEDGKFTSKDGSKEYRQNTNYGEILRNTIKLPDETIPKSVGAKWVNEEIMMPDGGKASFVEGSIITHKQVFAGKGTKKPIRDINRLLVEYPNSKADLWQKVKGVAELRYQHETFKAEIHWYEEPSIGRVEIKHKKYLD